MPLRKTYSEQSRPWNDNRNKPWQRSRSYGPRPPPFDPPLPRPPPPPIVISTATKSKLQTFQFQPPPPEEDVFVDADVKRANREDTAAGDATRKTAGTTPPRMASSPSRPVLQPVSNDTSSSTNRMDAAADSAEDKENKENKENHNGALPSTQPNKVALPVAATPEFLSIHVGTPRARFAWQDLAGTPDTPRVTESLGMSPNAQLSWMPEGENARMPSPAAGAPPKRPGGGAKRPLSSSSPPSSPSHSSRSKTAARNVQKFKDALKNALANPVAPAAAAGRTRLARHHTAVGGSTAAGAAAAAAAAAEAKAASPDGPLSRGPSPFRRTVSCVDALPATKRRRIDAPAETPTRVRPLPPAAVSPPPDRADLVMADAAPPRTQHAQRAQPLSPVVAPASRPAPPNPSPPPAAMERLSLHVNDEANATAESTRDNSRSVDRQPPPADETDSTSDYGDDLFDDDVLAELDASTAPPEVLAELPNAAASGARKNEPPRATTTTGSSQDEFGEFDDDVFEAAEDMMTQINSGCPPAKGSVHEIVGAAVPQRQAAPHADSSDADDAYGDDFGDDFDFDAVEKAATQAAGTTATGHPTPWASLPDSSQKPRAIQRYLVKNVIPSMYTDEKKRTSTEKVLSVQADGNRAMRTVHLRGDWVDTPASVKAFVHVLGDFDAAGRCVVDNDHNMLILHPDQLVSSTVVADSFSCTRRAVLQDRVKATSEPGPPLVYGTLLHEIFQEALTANQWSSAFLDAAVEGVIRKHLEDLYTIKVEPSTAREHLQTRTRELQAWARLFVAPQPRPGAVALGRNGEKVRMAVRKLLDVEEHVWSPMYGLKGNIDATVEVVMEQSGTQGGGGLQTLTVPFELKTGRNASSSHQAQTVLYNLLLSDRYDIEIVYGVLYYMENSQMLRIPTIRHELRHMIMKRNELACYVRERSVQLPPMLRSQNQCERCFAQTACFLYHKLADGGDGATSGMGGAFDGVTGHLTARHRDFFLKWEDLLTKEERESQKLRRELWTMVSSEREKLGRCFADVVIEPGSAVVPEDGGGGGGAASSASKINRFQYTLIKQSPAAGFSFQDSEMAVGEPIVISDEAGHFALALGYVTAVRRQRITVAVDRRLHNARVRQAGFDDKTNQVFSSTMDTTAAGGAAVGRKGNDDGPVVRYRLDKDEFSNGMALVRNNLVQVMAAGQLGSRKIRELVVDLVAPRFRAASSAPPLPPPPTTAPTESLNVDQQRAIDKVMSAQDYALVLGMPGTGKTTTIAHIIRALIRKGKSVLLTSYTHTAVDNILLKLRTADMPPILRLGALAKVHPEVREFCVLASEPKTSFEAIRAAWHAPPVVATTCLGVQHPLFHERVFDYCIVDEASQITLPICLGPIRMADRFVLVGDHNQLPPIVQNEAARAGGLDVSLFKLLSDTHPASVVNLEHQYRMCEDVMTLSNTLIYRGRLKCGTEALRTRSLAVPDLGRLAQHHHHDGAPGVFCAGGSDDTTTTGAAAPCWLRDLVAPARRVAFVNTDAIDGSREESKGNRIVNVCEARVVAQLVEAFLTVGVPAAEVGVMTHYRSQLALLKQQLRGVTAAASAAGGGRHIEMHTTDRFQGRDKEVIVLSLVRNNEACNIGDLLKDWRRINVAFTRAKTKLLVVGSRSTLKGMAAAVEAATQAARATQATQQPGPGTPDTPDTPDTAAAMDDINGEEMLGRFIRLMEERRWVYDLPADALDSHVFAAFPATQAASSLPGPGAGPSLPASAAPPTPAASSPPKRVPLGPVPDRANRQPLKRARAGPDALLKGKPVLRDILNSMMGGAYSC